MLKRGPGYDKKVKRSDVHALKGFSVASFSTTLEVV